MTKASSDLRQSISIHITQHLIARGHIPFNKSDNAVRRHYGGTKGDGGIRDRFKGAESAFVFKAAAKFRCVYGAKF
jgi:hypothetical protein